MSKYRITLEGKIYEMEIEIVEEIGSGQPIEKKEYREYNAFPKDSNVNVVDPSVQKQTINNMGTVVAPMPGTVLKIEKCVGEEVKSGDIILILEAMKMENEIIAPVDGKIVKMNCQLGSTVAGGELLFEIK